ncbi:MAG: nitrite/sulfite reductase [Candidatus Omnitrophica bacterium]|nr:nitrite/sulfite reductase [Candidatus Omnitrophota bacterium]
MKKPFSPNFNTPQQDLSKEELNKLASNGIRGNLAQEFRNDAPDIAWEAEALAKSHGIYLEFNRAATGDPKEWMYLIRIGVPGGGPITREQWRVVDELSEKYTIDPQGHTSLRLTNRQNIQFHWVKKPGVIPIVKGLAEKGLYSLNGCGDNTRNVMACPLSHYSDLFNARAWAHKTAEYFRLPVEPFIEIFAIDPKYLRKPGESFAYGPNLLNRKFKIAFSTLHRDAKTGKLVPDNCVELLTHDMSVAPVIANGEVSAFQIYVGGGQGERNGKPSTATLGKPLTIVSEDQLMKVLDGVVAVHQKYGDRQNRFWARLKYVILKDGVDAFRDKVSAQVGFKLPLPEPTHDYGNRHLHFGWQEQPSNGLLAYGVFIENGRLADNSPNGRLKSMVRDIMNKYRVEFMITPNQDVLFTNIPKASMKDFEAELKKYGYGARNGNAYSELRLHSGACVGRDTCRLTYTDSEKFEPFLIDDLEKLGWGDMKESIGITGCERQCFRPATKTIGLVGSGMDRYQFKLFGDETGRFQGKPLIPSDGEKMYLRSVPREQVPVVIDTLLKFYKQNRQANEGLGTFHRRVGADGIIRHLQENDATKALMEKPAPTDCVLE